jgi:uncharacterized membrane protein
MPVDRAAKLVISIGMVGQESPPPDNISSPG